MGGFFRCDWNKSKSNGTVFLDSMSSNQSAGVRDYKWEQGIMSKHDKQITIHDIVPYLYKFEPVDQSAFNSYSLFWCEVIPEITDWHDENWVGSLETIISKDYHVVESYDPDGDGVANYNKSKIKYTNPPHGHLLIQSSYSYQPVPVQLTPRKKLIFALRTTGNGGGFFIENSSDINKYASLFDGNTQSRGWNMNHGRRMLNTEEVHQNKERMHDYTKPSANAPPRS